MTYLNDLRELEFESKELLGDKANLVKEILKRARELILLVSNASQEGKRISEGTRLRIECLLNEADEIIHLTLN